MTVLYILGAIVIGFFALMIGLRIVMVLKARGRQRKAVPALGGKQGKHVGKGRTARFYFNSPGCGACAAMTPVETGMAKKYKGVFPVDISRDMDTARKFGVMATPTTVLVKKGLIEKVIIGPQPGHALEALIAD